jgi:SAM-dependent methyltransferase
VKRIDSLQLHNRLDYSAWNFQPNDGPAINKKIMSAEDRNKWNQRYAEDSYRKTNPVTLLSDWLPKIPVGKALDVACGAGRNTIFLAEAGFRVDAIDISHKGLEQTAHKATESGLTVNCIEHDLDESYAFTTDYDLIVVLWYVNLKLIRQLCDCLAPGGFLLCEEHLRSEQEVIGPGNPDYRVAPGALRDAVSTLDLLLYEEVVEPIPEGGQVASARVVARKA